MKQAVRLFVDASGAGEVPAVALAGVRGDDAGNVTAAECFLLVIDRHGPAWIPILPPLIPRPANPKLVLDQLRRDAEERLNARRAQDAQTPPARLIDPPDISALEQVLRHPEGRGLLRAVVESSETKALRDFLRGMLLSFKG